jgi:hypothetical protein
MAAITPAVPPPTTRISVFNEDMLFKDLLSKSDAFPKTGIILPSETLPANLTAALLEIFDIGYHLKRFQREKSG